MRRRSDASQLRTRSTGTDAQASGAADPPGAFAPGASVIFGAAEDHSCGANGPSQIQRQRPRPVRRTRCRQAGWYPDVHAPGTLRYWGGAQWTSHTVPAAYGQPPSTGPAKPAHGGDPNATKVSFFGAKKRAEQLQQKNSDGLQQVERLGLGWRGGSGLLSPPRPGLQRPAGVELVDDLQILVLVTARQDAHLQDVEVHQALDWLALGQFRGRFRG
ncbi:hypothetical protein ACVWWN_000250 [Mycobacterium sp. URHB0021]